MAVAAASGEIITASELATLKTRQDALERELGELRAQLAGLCAELGVGRPTEV
jgi:hypothetical protein